MSMKRPPAHRADAPIVFVHPADEAWDHVRVYDEQKKMSSGGLDPKSHPVARYMSGETRYDIEAPGAVGCDQKTPSEYLNGTETRWVLKRLSWEDYVRIRPRWDRDIAAGVDPLESYSECCRVGIVSVTGDDAPELEGCGLKLTWNDMQKIHEISISHIHYIGQAVFVASLPLTEQESKP